MQRPFTVEQFYDVFRDHATAVWPAWCFLAALALTAVAAASRPRHGFDVAVSDSGFLAAVRQRHRTSRVRSRAGRSGVVGH